MHRDVNDFVVELDGVVLSRGNKKILDDVGLSVGNGDCCVVLGPNGSGKSSLMAVIAGYLWPTAGSVSVFGCQFGKVNLASIRRRIGLIEPSRMPRFDSTMTVREVVSTGLFGTLMLFNRELSAEQESRVEEELVAVGLGDFGSSMLGQLSSGEMMKVYLARAMVADPELLILDEPTVGLDIGARAEIVRMLDDFCGREGRSVVVVSHHLDELPNKVDKMVLMRGGRVFRHGGCEEILVSDIMSEAFGCELEIVRSRGRYMAFCK